MATITSFFTYARAALGFAPEVEQDQTASTDNVCVDVKPLIIDDDEIEEERLIIIIIIVVRYY
jgi:hypothetical protein